MNARVMLVFGIGKGIEVRGWDRWVLKLDNNGDDDSFGRLEAGLALLSKSWFARGGSASFSISAAPRLRLELHHKRPTPVLPSSARMTSNSRA